MKKLFVVLGLCTALVSCQKELNIDLGTTTGGGTGTGGTGGTSGSRLVKVVSVSGSETLTTLYTYDSQNRTQTSTLDGSSGGMILHTYYRYERDAVGRITRTVQQATQNGAVGDSVYTNYHYPNATTFEYDYSLGTMSYGGFVQNDSTVYTFAAGKLTRVSKSLSSPLLGNTVISVMQTDFTNDASGHVTAFTLSSSTVPGGPLSVVASETFTYGASLDPTWFSSSAAQNYIVNGLPNTAPEAVTKLDVVSPAQPAANMSIINTYVGIAGGRPSSSTTVTTGAQAGTTNYTYFYN